MDQFEARRIADAYMADLSSGKRRWPEWSGYCADGREWCETCRCTQVDAALYCAKRAYEQRRSMNEER